MSVDFPCIKDARLARRESDNFDQGAGTGTGLAYGLYSGYRYRALLGFSVNMSGWTSISKAEFWYKSSNQINVAFGSDPTFIVQRCTGAWSEGGSSSLSSSNAVVYPGPTAVSTNQVIADAPTAESTWASVDITAMMRDVLNGGAFTGLMLKGSTNAGVESDSSSNVGEIFAREYGSGIALLRITYATNRAPNAPTVTSPNVTAGVSGTTTPTLDFLLSDPDGNAMTSYQWQIDDNADFSSPIQTLMVSGPFANNSHATVVPAALTRGTTYYVRAQAFDGTAWGPYNSPGFSFKVASLPTMTVSEPSGAGRLARLVYNPGSGWASPSMVINWAMVCPDGGSQASYQVEVAVDAAGSPGANQDNYTGSGGNNTYLTTNALTEGNYYHVRVTATCSHGLSVVVGYRRVRVRWGVVTHRFDMGAPTGSLAQTVLDVTDETTTGQGKVVVEYMTTTGLTAPVSWSDTFGGAGLNRYFWYRAWLLTWGASPAVSPSLNQLSITYSTVVVVPDKWTRSDETPSSPISGDVSSYVYGTKSMRLVGNGAVNYAWQKVPVAKDTLYMLSGRIQTVGAAGAYIELANAAIGGTVARTPAQAAGVKFETPVSRVALQPDPLAVPPTTNPKPWNSGSNTDIYIRLVMPGPVGTTAWFDAIKLEASTVVTPWSPGYVADAVVLDAGGLSIDGYNGGIFRLRGSDGLASSEITLGASGLMQGGAPLGGGVFVGNSPPPIPANGQLWWDDDDATVGGSQTVNIGTVFPSSPQPWDMFFRTDLGRIFWWTGARWQSEPYFVAHGATTLVNGVSMVNNATQQPECPNCAAGVTVKQRLRVRNQSAVAGGSVRCMDWDGTVVMEVLIQVVNAQLWSYVELMTGGTNGRQSNFINVSGQTCTLFVQCSGSWRDGP